jgi:hypothetical protein
MGSSKFLAICLFSCLVALATAFNRDALSTMLNLKPQASVDPASALRGAGE